MPRLSSALLGVAMWGALAAPLPALAQAATGPATPASAASALPHALPLKRDEPAQASSAAPAAWGVAIMLALLAVAAGVVVRRRGWPARLPDPRRRDTGAIVRVSSKALTPQASVHAIRWSGEEILVACTPHAVSVIARRPLPSADGEGA